MKRGIGADFSPKALLKARRPEQFSDTLSLQRTALDRSLLEYHLASVTSRSQEVQFQRFVKRLCERVVCPNLLPQTGPTGGGDSKVDAETYPVAEELSLTWYVGLNSGAHTEKWAFAVSAMKAWKTKFRADVTKAVATGRGYKKVFFVTNQAVSDRERAMEEDELRAKHGIDVHVFDRTWILESVFSQNLTHLAVEELGVTAVSRQEVQKGPVDAKRERRLNELDQLLNESTACGASGPHLAEIAIESAQLARSLERSRAEVDGRLHRAEELAERHGTERQRVEAAYQTAWTLFWWYEDYRAFAEQYSKVESLASSSENAYDLERLTSIWQLLKGSVARGLTVLVSPGLPARTATLTASLERLASKDDRPSTALHAETLLCQLRLVEALSAGRDAGSEFRKLREIVGRGKGLIGFPLDLPVKLVTELGSMVQNSAEFDELFETIVAASAASEGEIRGAQLLVTRGAQLLSGNRPAESIAMLGRAFAGLFKHESRDDAVHALYLCACAYAAIGLLWAARGTLLAAASIATNDYWQYGEITPYQASCYRRLKWIEVQLGRIPQTLAWHELDAVVRGQLVARGLIQRESEEGAPFQLALGQLLLRADLDDLRDLERLPSVLDRLGLEFAADALLFALGHEDRLGETAVAMDMNDARTLAMAWRILSADMPLARRPELGLHSTVQFTTNVLGCRITVTCETQEPCVEIAEAILGTLESLLATSALTRAVAVEPEATVAVRASDSLSGLVVATMATRGGRPHVDVDCRRGKVASTPAAVHAIRGATFEAAIRVLATCVTFHNMKSDLEVLFRDERVSDRASSFASGIGMKRNVLGRVPKTSVAAWPEAGDITFPLRRSERWDSGEPEPPPINLRVKADADEPPDRGTMTNVSHASISMISPIRLRLWDRAGWHGVVYLGRPGVPPTMALMFSDRGAPIDIFRQWKLEEARKELRLHVTIVRGVDRANRHAYCVMVGAVPEATRVGTGFVVLGSRLCRMDPPSSANLERFLADYEMYCRFSLAPAYKSKESPPDEPPAFALALSVEPTSMKVVHAWQIGPNDIERSAIHDDCDPMIPEGVVDAPVLEVLRQNRERKRSTLREAVHSRPRGRTKSRSKKKRKK